MCLSSGPRCVARCDYDGQEEDELTFSQGDVIALSELIGQDWGRGQIHGRTGIFPLSFTQVLEPLPTPSPKATTEAISLTKDVTLLENTGDASTHYTVHHAPVHSKQSYKYCIHLSNVLYHVYVSYSVIFRYL